MAHRDTNRVDESIVKLVEAPEFTDTWHPYAHGQIIEALEEACNEHMIAVKSKQYSLNATGTRMFGVWDLALGDGQTGYSLGIRNSTDKSMVLGVCAGTHVFVCDNMCFFGEFIQFRKHTSGLDLAELKEVGYNAIAGAVTEMEKMVDWQNGMHEVWMSPADRKSMVYDMMAQGVFSPSNFNKYLTCLEEEKAIVRGQSLDGAHSLYNMHGAATRMMRDWNLLRTADATGKLNSICNNYIDRN